MYETSSVGRTEWQDSRWKIGTEPGRISIYDVILLGIAWVSPGRVMPLLQVKPDFGEQVGIFVLEREALTSAGRMKSSLHNVWTTRMKEWQRWL